MVADLMSSLPENLTKNGGRKESDKEDSTAEILPMKTAEKMVADIMSSFRENAAAKKDEVAEIGGGSGGLGTGMNSADSEEGEEEAKVKDEAGGREAEEKDMGEGEVGVHSARQGCEDCR